MTRRPVRVLGVDPGLTRCGLGVIEGPPASPRQIASILVLTPREAPIAGRLKLVFDGVTAAIEEHRPDVVACEQVLFARNVQTAIGTAQALGVALLAAEQAGLPAFTYSPTHVKSAVTGYGQADKFAVQRMVTQQLALAAVPKPADLADALAVALCHLVQDRLTAIDGLAGGGTDPDAVMGPALALELLHTCALLHDDIIDAAPTRRGRTASHVAFADLHRAGSWNGDADHFGTSAAILLGDLAFVQADEVFLQASVEPERLLAGFRVFTELREEVMAGQYLDVLAATMGTTSREVAMTIASYKSGRYSVARPLQMGAVLAGAPPVIGDGLLRVGDPLGQAFQIRDDLLGVFGTEGETGKSATGDLAEGKRTLLVAETDARLSGAERDRFRSLLGRADLTDELADELRDLMRSSGGLDATSKVVEELVDRSLGELDGLDVDPDAAQVLRDLAAYIGLRRS